MPHDLDLSVLSLEELINLRGRVTAEISRKQILYDTPVKVGELASQYASAGGDPEVLRAVIGPDSVSEGA